MPIDFTQYKLSAIKSPIDNRDYVSTAVIPIDSILPPKLSHKASTDIVLDQGPYGICVGCSGAGLKNKQEQKSGTLPIGGFSPVYLYTLCKQIDGIPNIWGTYPRTSLQVLIKDGILPYDDMPISVIDGLGGKLPEITPAQIAKATPYKIASYAQVPLSNLLAVKQALVNGPVKFALGVANQFFNPEQGRFIAPPSGTLYGGHDVLLVGYDDDMMYTYADGRTEKGFLELQNSWGKHWGNGGYAYVPYSALDWKWPVSNGIEFIWEMWSAVDFDQSPVKPKYWRIQTGAFSVKTNAQNYQAQLKLKGLATYLVYIDGLWKVQLGAFLLETNCRNEAARVKALGISNFVTYY